MGRKPARKHTERLAGAKVTHVRRCEVCESGTSRGSICPDCLAARKRLSKPLQGARKALLWRVRNGPPKISPGQVNYALRTHWDSLTTDARLELDGALERFFGPTQTAYEALLHFGLQELDARGQLSDFPGNLRELRTVAHIRISSSEVALLEGRAVPMGLAAEDSPHNEIADESLESDADQAPANRVRRSLVDARDWFARLWRRVCQAWGWHDSG